MKKTVFIIIDGLGDRPIPELGNKTPLEAAKTPNLDFLAKKGICGLIKPYLFPWQKFPESDTCHLALFGFDPKKYYLGRGVYEAAGVGIKLKKGDVAFRANFATCDENFKVIDRRAGRIKDTKLLIPVLNRLSSKICDREKLTTKPRIFIKKSLGHRAVLILRGENLSAKISNSDPRKIGEKIKKVLPRDRSRKAKLTAKILNEFLKKAHQILKSHPLNKKREKQGLLPANCFLTRGAGEFRKTPSFEEKYGLKACCIAAGSLYKGIGKILGMDLIKIKGATGGVDTNLKGKILAAKESLVKYDFIFLHIKATDSLAEDGNFLGKKEFIEKIDKNLRPLLELKNVLIVVTADHSTCSKLKRHCLEPIPFLIYGKGRNGAKNFSERECIKGKLGKIKQLEVMSIILKLAKTKKGPGS